MLRMPHRNEWGVKVDASAVRHLLAPLHGSNHSGKTLLGAQDQFITKRFFIAPLTCTARHRRPPVHPISHCRPCRHTGWPGAVPCPLPRGRGAGVIVGARRRSLVNPLFSLVLFSTCVILPPKSGDSFFFEHEIIDLVTVLWCCQAGALACSA